MGLAVGDGWVAFFHDRHDDSLSHGRLAKNKRMDFTEVLCKSALKSAMRSAMKSAVKKHCEKVLRR